MFIHNVPIMVTGFQILHTNHKLKQCHVILRLISWSTFKKISNEQHLMKVKDLFLSPVWYPIHWTRLLFFLMELYKHSWILYLETDHSVFLFHVRSLEIMANADWHPRELNHRCSPTLKLTAKERPARPVSPCDHSRLIKRNYRVVQPTEYHFWVYWAKNAFCSATGE